MEDYLLISGIVGLVTAAGLAFIPANIAKRKGYSFGLWWFYGWMLFIVAIIHVSFIPDKNVQSPPVNAAPIPYSPPSYSSESIIEEVGKYRSLMEQGIITEAEYEGKRRQLIKLI